MSNTPVGGTDPSINHGHQRHRVRKFILPNGRRAHIAASPEEAERLRRKLSTAVPQEEFDLYIHGTPEHLEALRNAHTHHLSKQETMRLQHGQIFDEIDSVRSELEALSEELSSLTSLTVDLDANFSKYGYDAHLRTRDAGDSGGSTPRRGSETPKSAQDWESELKRAKPVKLWKRPVVRQYFHKGLLWRSSTSAEVASFELFVDLLYVGIIAINGDTATENATGDSLLRFAITFILSWKIWTDMTLIIGWFETDDILQRLAVLFSMACLFGFTTNMVASRDQTYSQLIAFYLAARLFVGTYYLQIAYLLPMIKATMIANTVCVIIPSAIWIGSIYVEEPKRQALVWIALMLDLNAPTLIIFAFRKAARIKSKLSEKTQKLFEFYPALSIEHRTARQDAFVTLVFGYSVVALIYQNQAPLGLNAFFGKAILGLVMAFSFNWMYFEIDGQNLFVHAIRRHVSSALVWTTAHLPFIMAYVIGSAAMSRLVIAHDCSNANEDTLEPAYAARSEGELSNGIRWFFCGGIGIALASMGVISLTHVHKEIDTQRVRKSHRLALRFAISIVIICLALADHLNSIQLIGTVSSLVVFSLLFDLYGISCTTQSFIGMDGKCSYHANLHLKKKDVEEAAKTGVKVDLNEISREDRYEKGAFDT